MEILALGTGNAFSHINFNQSFFDNRDDWDKKSIDDGFKGFLQMGQKIEI